MSSKKNYYLEEPAMINLNTFFIDLVTATPSLPMDQGLQYRHLEKYLTDQVKTSAMSSASQFFQKAGDALQNNDLRSSVRLFNKARKLWKFAERIPAQMLS
jgi:hypothetical protein